VSRVEPDDRELVQLLIENEGFKSSAYKDSLGYLTIGIGRLIDARKGGGITREEGEFLCKNDVTRNMRELDAALPWWRDLDQTRQRVLVDMAFNMGVGKWGESGLLDFVNTLTALKEGRYQRVHDGILWLDVAKTKPTPYHVQTKRRAKRNAHTMLAGIQHSYAALGLR
jgi:lysozyme